MQSLFRFFSTGCIAVLWSANVALAQTTDIVVTIKPLQSLVQGVMGNAGKATLLISGSASPHDFHLKPSQVRALNNAKAVFYIDPTFETFLVATLPTLPKNVRQVAISDTPDLILLKRRTKGVWDSHDHQSPNSDDDHDHDHAESNNRNTHDIDMHLWLHPDNAKNIVRYVVMQLSKIDPSNQSIFEGNGQRIIQRITDLDRIIKLDLRQTKAFPYIVFHDAYQYFEHAYGLNGIGSITIDPHITPTPKRIKQVRDRLNELDAVCVFSEPQFPDRLINTVMDGMQSRSAVLDPLGADLAAGEQMYFQLMLTMTKAFRSCLAAAS